MTNEEKRKAGMMKFQQHADEMTKLEKFTLSIFCSISQGDDINYDRTSEIATELAELLLCEIAFAEHVHKDEINEC